MLSLYLNTEPAGGNADAYRLRLRSMLKEVDSPKDNERIEQYFSREYDWSGRSVAVFSCADEEFFRAFPLAVSVRSRVRVSDHPHFKPLADLWDAFGGYGVALVDKQGARFFHFTLGELEEQQGFLGEEVKHTKSGGASSIAGMRGGSTGQTGYIEEVVGRNMKESASFAAKFFENNHIRRVLIGGTEENVSSFRVLSAQSLAEPGCWHLPNGYDSQSQRSTGKSISNWPRSGKSQGSRPDRSCGHKCSQSRNGIGRFGTNLESGC